MINFTFPKANNLVDFYLIKGYLFILIGAYMTSAIIFKNYPSLYLTEEIIRQTLIYFYTIILFYTAIILTESKEEAKK